MVICFVQCVYVNLNVLTPSPLSLGNHMFAFHVCESFSDTCTPTFTAALFILAKTWTQPKCLSTDERIKIWHVYTMDYYSAIKKNEIRSFVATWMAYKVK